MKILKATRFDSTIKKGGSTMPWIVFALDGQNEVPYVVKLFSQRTIDQQFAVAKEVFGNYFAKEFSLSVPECALIDFDNDFIESLDEEYKNRLKTVHHGLKFGTVLQDQMINYSPAIHRKHLRDYEFAGVFALDCILYNVDRGRRADKPNILIDDERFLLIDHEQCLHFVDGQPNHYNLIIKQFREGKLDYNYSQHLFYNDLRGMWSSQKIHLFDEFCEYLNAYNTDGIKDLGIELSRLNVSMCDYHKIFEYFCFLKKETNLVQKGLFGSIS